MTQSYQVIPNEEEKDSIKTARIKTTLEWFWKHPYKLEFQYRFIEFWYRLRHPQGKIDTELYPILRIIHQLGGREYVKRIYFNVLYSPIESDDEAEFPAKELYQKFRDIFDILYAENNEIVKPLNPKDHRQAKKRALLLHLMSILKTRINRFGREHGMDEVLRFNPGTDKKGNPIHRKKQINNNELPSYSWVSPEEDDETEQQRIANQEARRQKKVWVKPIAKVIAFFVAIGQAFIGAYAIYEAMLQVGAHIAWLSAPVLPPLMAAIIFVSTLTTNYILFRNRTINTMIQFFINKEFFGGFKHPVAKALAVLGLFSALAAGFIMGAVSWIGCMSLIPYPSVAMAAGGSLMVLNLVSYTSLMYVSIINLMKHIAPKLKIDYWQEAFKDTIAEWKKAPIENTLRWILNTCLFAAGMALLLFSLTSLLGSWLDHVVLLFTNTLPVFLQVSPAIAEIISITLVLGLAAAVRSAFNFESIFSLVEYCTDKILDNPLTNAIRSAFGCAPEESTESVEQDSLQLSDIWNDPLNTVFSWSESAFKFLTMIFNAIGFSALATMGYDRLSEIGIKNELVAKIGSFGATGAVSLGAVSGEMRKASEPKIDKVSLNKVFSSPVSQSPSQDSVPESSSGFLKKEEEVVESRLPVVGAGHNGSLQSTGYPIYTILMT